MVTKGVADPLFRRSAFQSARSVGRDRFEVSDESVLAALAKSSRPRDVEAVRRVRRGECDVKTSLWWLYLDSINGE